jgi:hypothetical protein
MIGRTNRWSPKKRAQNRLRMALCHTPTVTKR